jgi:hypothetical protein
MREDFFEFKILYKTKINNFFKRFVKFNYSKYI